MIDEYYQIHVARYQQILKTVSSLGLSSNSKILDVGCFPLHLFHDLEKKGYKVYGVSSVHEPTKHPNVKVCDLENDPIPFEPDQFDLVIFTEVFEHLHSSPQKVVAEIKRVLKPGGYLIFTTPNVLRFQNIINLIVGKNIYFPLFQLDQPLNFRHHREYTRQEILEIVHSLGLNVIVSRPTISYPPFRQRNQNDSIPLKFIKYANFLFSLLVPSRRDTLFFLVQKPL